ncbi:hypothetical protein KP509_03G074000 [Ceratopteris richardii]|uniref:Aminotransferase class I/classII large domain-containing protein n=1 Tax=Ceratopteris richardii TaxID=49495 RepID=A0A8T2V4L7_CERRI|nr:hypothetical protein KP509_03G074000 [Ceratopteris richardii]
MIICNPNNPCGVVYNCEHHLKLPIIAYEIYGHIAFKDRKFCLVASVAVVIPVLTVGGLSKKMDGPWLAPWMDNNI